MLGHVDLAHDRVMKNDRRRAVAAHGCAEEIEPRRATMDYPGFSTGGFTAGAAQVWTQSGSQSCRLHFDSPRGSGR